ncbi:hypothetical protein SEA_LILBEANIE_89 [Gordonia phage Lilbeanie]|uniref:Glycosyltransferase n=1 Tax=Gordonia phage Lilbeanie TaxID=2794947 RepID=A0A7T1KSC6_9CAUD|nr:hypothetical protein J1773_gp89 [Gordonia phage Lilbeanie]QPO17167.1 hypothetical protein SEA_LILBEANIE_89 [Gordonia phage Lilbeanie]
MSVTSTTERAGLLVAVITGGRPKLQQRLTRRFLESLAEAGHPVVWVLSDRDQPGYETDDYEQAVYTREWAESYAADHWMLPKPPDPDGFLGAFPGREWACREAERRGCWGVLQLDDNIERLSFPRGSSSAINLVRERGGMAFFADLLAGVALSTNSRMTGAQLDAVVQLQRQVARAGFPYSCFVERVGPGREEWFGPFEDDITHAFQYGTRADGATAAVMPMLRYMKESKSKTGMRAKYNHERAVQLQRIFPQGASVKVMSTRSNGKGEARVFHKMAAGAIRNPLVVQDEARWNAVRETHIECLAEFSTRIREANRVKVLNRAAKVEIANGT